MVSGLCEFLCKELDRFLRQQLTPYYLGTVRSHDSFYTDDEQTICQYWNRKGVSRCRHGNIGTVYCWALERVNSFILNNVVLYEQDVKDGVGQYVDEAKVMMEGERLASLAALEAAIAQ